MKLFNIFLIICLLFNSNCEINRSNTKSAQNIMISDFSNIEYQIKNYDTIFIKSGNYTIDKPIWRGEVSKDVTIIGLGKVTFRCATQFAHFTAPVVHKGILKG